MTSVTDAHAVTHFADVPGGSFVVGTDRPWIPADGEGPSRTVQLASFRIAHCAEHPRTARCQQLCDFPPDAGGDAGDQCCFVF